MDEQPWKQLLIYPERSVSGGRLNQRIHSSRIEEVPL
jgi:hypothetical protein